jgi:hypothetical protein
LAERIKASTIFKAEDFCATLFLQGERFDTPNTFGIAKPGDRICTENKMVVIDLANEENGREKMVNAITHELGH